MDTNLYKREGKAITNFNNQLPEEDSDLAQQIIKDPYIFDFLSIGKNYDEKEKWFDAFVLDNGNLDLTSYM